jgi:hypothetical protein
MSAILRLYPRAWRARYGDELAALLEEQPATLFDSLDLIRGALDARLHPQVPGTDVTPEQETPMNIRRLGAVAAIGGIVWLIAIVSTLVLPLDVEGNRDTSIATLGLAFAIGLTGIALGELGSRRGSTSSATTGHLVAVVSVVLGGLLLGGWPLLIIPLIGFPIVGFLAAVRGARNEAMPGWLAVVFGVAAIASIAGTFGVGTDTEVGMVLLSSIGLAALVLAWAAISGLSTGSTEAHPA